MKVRFVKTASYANAMQSKKEYSRLYSSFLGVDVSSDPASVSEQRFPYCVNMWKDYKADIGEVISTIPGYRKSTALGNITPDGAVRGIFSQYVGNEHYVYMHIGSALYWATKRQILESPVTTMALRSQSGIIVDGLDEGISTGIPYSDKFLHLDGTNYRIVSNLSASIASEVATVPTIQFNGEDYMPRNILTNKVNHRFLNANLVEKNSYGLTYEYDDEEMTATVIKVNDAREVIYVPETTEHDGKTYTVTEIGEYFLSTTLQQSDHNYQNRVKTIVCANTVTKINKYAFYNCTSLKIAVIPGVVSIGEQAFTNADNLNTWYINKDLHIDTSAFTEYNGYPRTCVLDGAFSNADSYAKLMEITKEGSNIFTNCRYVEALTNETVNVSLPTASGGALVMGYDSTYTSAPYSKGSNFVTDTYKSTPLVEMYESFSNSSRAYIALTIRDKLSGDVLNNEGYTETVFPLSKGIRNDNLITLTFDGVAVNKDLWEINHRDGYVESISYFSKGEDTKLKDNVTIDIAGEADEEYLKGDPDYKDFLAQTRYDGTFANAINHCTIMCEFDDRVFLGGNSDLPNVLFFCDRNEQGIYDPTYFGSTSYVTVGSSTDTCKVFITAPSYLTVIKDGNGSVYVLKPVTMEDEEYTRTYSITEGVSGVGAIGPGISFYDDKVFLSERGLDSITPSSIQLERSIVHRSLNIDRLLLSETRDDLAAACMTVWQGYLAMLVGSRIYLADSRALSNRGYEWFVLEDIYSWESDYEVYRYTSKPSGYPSKYYAHPDKLGETVDKDDVRSVQESVGWVYYVPESVVNGVEYGRKFIVDTDGERQGGVAHLPTAIWSDGEVLLVGFKNGDVCIFNTDKRGESIVNDELVKEGDFSPEVYQRCGHAYVSGFSTKLDNCGIPHLAKNTVKGSLVLKLKATVGLNARISCRTDRETWRKLEAREQENMISEIKGGDLDFTRIAFDLATFETKDDIHVIVREEKRRWIEKQYYIYTDRHKSCLAVKNIAYRYNVSGTIRDRDV